MDDSDRDSLDLWLEAWLIRVAAFLIGAAGCLLVLVIIIQTMHWMLKTS